MARSIKTANELIEALRLAAKPENREGMSRFGIEVSAAIGVSMPQIRAIAKTAHRDHLVAGELWTSGLHEARILAALVEEPEKVTRQQMDRWAADFNSWDLCDQVTGNLFDRLPYAEDAIKDWRLDEREFVKRAAYTMIAWRAVHLKQEPDETFLAYLPMIEEGSDDARNFVKKAVNWALRQIGKRSAELHGPALDLAQTLSNSHERSAVWIGRNAASELTDPKVLARLGLATDQRA